MVLELTRLLGLGVLLQQLRKIELLRVGPLLATTFSAVEGAVGVSRATGETSLALVVEPAVEVVVLSTTKLRRGNVLLAVNDAEVLVLAFDEFGGPGLVLSQNRGAEAFRLDEIQPLENNILWVQIVPVHATEAREQLVGGVEALSTLGSEALLGAELRNRRRQQVQLLTELLRSIVLVRSHLGELKGQNRR